MPGALIKQIGFGGNTPVVLAGRHTFVTSMKYVNEDSAIRFLQVFDAATAAAVTVGTTTPDWVLTAGANGGDDDFVGDGMVFLNGVVVVGTTTATGSTGAGAATQHVFAVVE